MVWGEAIYRIRSPSELLDFDLRLRENGKIQKYEDDPKKKRRKKTRERKSKTSENLKKKGKNGNGKNLDREKIRSCHQRIYSSSQAQRTQNLTLVANLATIGSTFGHQVAPLAQSCPPGCVTCVANIALDCPFGIIS